MKEVFTKNAYIKRTVILAVLFVCMSIYAFNITPYSADSAENTAFAADGTILIDNCDTDGNAAGVKYEDRSEYITGTGSLRSLVSLNPKILIEKEINLGDTVIDDMYLTFYFYADTLSNAVADGCYVKLYTENGYYLYPLAFTKNGWQNVYVEIKNMQDFSAAGTKITAVEFSWAVAQMTGSTDTRSDTFIRVDEIAIAAEPSGNDFTVQYNDGSALGYSSVDGLTKPESGNVGGNGGGCGGSADSILLSVLALGVFAVFRVKRV
jgi:hypothetical protein